MKPSSLKLKLPNSSSCAISIIFALLCFPKPRGQGIITMSQPIPLSHHQFATAPGCPVTRVNRMSDLTSHTTFFSERCTRAGSRRQSHSPKSSKLRVCSHLHLHSHYFLLRIVAIFESSGNGSLSAQLKCQQAATPISSLLW